MTGAQLAVKSRLLYNNAQTPETSLKGPEEEFQAKVETTKTAASTKKTDRQQAERGRDVVSQLASYVAIQSERTRLKLSEYFASETSINGC